MCNILPEKKIVEGKLVKENFEVQPSIVLVQTLFVYARENVTLRPKWQQLCPAAVKDSHSKNYLCILVEPLPNENRAVYLAKGYHVKGNKFQVVIINILPNEIFIEKGTKIEVATIIDAQEGFEIKVGTINKKAFISKEEIQHLFRSLRYTKEDEQAVETLEKLVREYVDVFKTPS